MVNLHRQHMPAGTCPGRLRRHCVIGYADPGQNPSAVRFGSSRVRGRGLGRAARSLPAAGSPMAVMRPERGNPMPEIVKRRAGASPAAATAGFQMLRS